MFYNTFGTMKYIFSHIWGIVWAIVMLIILLLPPNDLPDLSKFEIFPGVDKVVHMGIFFVLASLLYWESAMKSGWKGNKWITIAKIVISTVIFAIFTEEAQRHVSSRTADIYDIYADCLGIGMATFAFILLYRKEK